MTGSVSGEDAGGSTPPQRRGGNLAAWLTFAGVIVRAILGPIIVARIKTEQPSPSPAPMAVTPTPTAAHADIATEDTPYFEIVPKGAPEDPAPKSPYNWRFTQ
jgi:hypothetical protein